MYLCDQNPNVLSWASEPVKIPYKNPMPSKSRPAGSQSIYIPDFLVTYIKKGGGTVTKLIEIKPMHEAMESHARNSTDVAIRLKNEAKWGAAIQWASRRGVEFVVMTEAEMFSGHANRAGRKNPIRAQAKAAVKNNTPKPATKAAKKQTSKSLATGSRKTRSLAKSRVSTVGKTTRSRRIARR